MPVIEGSTQSLLQELQSVRRGSDRLFGVLNGDAIYDRPIAKRHRVLFYIGHLDGFDSIQVCREALGLQSPDPELDVLFQAGIDPDSSQLPTDTPADWPSLEQIYDYVRRCQNHVDANLEHASDDVVSMIIEHRQMHLETLAYMFHNFGYDRKRLDAAPALETARLSEQESSDLNNRWCEIPGGHAILGQPRGSFGWDNEFEQVSRGVPAFRVQRNKVTNGEYLDFVREGAKLPHFWKRRGDSIFYRGMFQEVPLPLDWPVYVSLKKLWPTQNGLAKTS